jgi:Alcohol dehydrogenase GroES-like domain
VLAVERAPVPVPAAITFDELTWDETWTRDGVSRTPVTPSHEVSGVVAESAPGVTEFTPGDQVYGLIPFDRDGAAAEFVAVPATDVAMRPSTVSHAQAATLPLAGLTNTALRRCSSSSPLAVLSSPNSRNWSTATGRGWKSPRRSRSSGAARLSKAADGMAGGRERRS